MVRLLLILLGAWVDVATARQARERRRAAWTEQQRQYWQGVETGAGLTRATREYLDTL